MDVDGAQKPASSLSRKAEKRRKEEKLARIDKKRIRKPRNVVAFGKKRVAKGGKR